MDNNFILCTIEDAWKEFERGGEISNSADNLLSVVTELMERDKCKDTKVSFLVNLIEDELWDCLDSEYQDYVTGQLNKMEREDNV
ncbi:putative coil containing protein [Vibrio phage 193E37-1]|nr:putative coil containing protein [Vibrio phage 193E37-1]